MLANLLATLIGISVLLAMAIVFLHFTAELIWSGLAWLSSVRKAEKNPQEPDAKNRQQDHA